MEMFIYKTAHIIFVISWMAGLFYLGRIFVYHREALDKNEPDKSILIRQFQLMEGRVYKIIMNPAMMLSWLFGLLMMYGYGLEWLKLNWWLHAKLFLVIGLTLYHLYCKRMIFHLKNEELPLSSFGFRLFNEVPTIFMVLIVSFAVFKNNTNPIKLSIVLIILIIVLILLTKLYKAIRNKA